MLASYVEPVRLVFRRAARAAAQGIVRVAHLEDQPGSREIVDPSQVGQSDAGWVQVLDVEDGRARGRGRLMLRSKRIRRGDRPGWEARIESFVPADEPGLASQEQVLLLVETANEHYPVTVRTIEAEGSVVTVSWPHEELPATLRELGGD